METIFNDPFQGIASKEKKELSTKYKESDLVLTHYWYNGMVTPVRIVRALSKSTYEVSHNVSESKIPNAPNEILKSSEIIDYCNIKNPKPNI